MARTCYRHYLIFEDRVEHIGREMRKRFPDKAGQKHPLLTVSYRREDGKVIIDFTDLEFGILDEDGRCSQTQFVMPGAKKRARANKGSKVVNIRDFTEVKLTDYQDMLVAARLIADFGMAMEEYVRKWLR